MDSNLRQQLEAHYWELEKRIQAIHNCQTVDGDPAQLEAELLEEQDAIEWEVGANYFKDGHQKS